MPKIEILQKKLYELDIKIVGKADGKFGPNTAKAVIIFKKNYDRSTADENTKEHYDENGLIWPPSDTESSDVDWNCFLAIDEAIVSNWRYKKPIVIVIDPGHGDIFNKYLDPGAIYPQPPLQYTHTEKDLALKVSISLNNKLNQLNNITSYLTREKDLDDKKRTRIVWRTNIVEQKDADIVISVHLNSSSNPKAKGFSVLTQKGSSNKHSILLANKITENYSLLKNRGVKSERSLGVLRRSEAFKSDLAAVLIELGFISNDTDRQVIIDKPDEIAEQLMKSIKEYIKEK